MQKNIAYLTDNASLQKSRMRVLRLVWKAKGLVVKVPKTFRTFARVSRKAVLSVAKFGRDKMERVPKVPKKLVAMGAHPPATSRFLPRGQNKFAPERAEGGFSRLSLYSGSSPGGSPDPGEDHDTDEEPSSPLRQDYSTHDHEVVCITKNKGGKHYEYVIKVSLAVDSHGMAVTHAEYPENWHDSMALQDLLDG